MKFFLLFLKGDNFVQEKIDYKQFEETKEEIKEDEDGSSKIIKTFKGHTSWVGSIAISPDNQKIASGSDDNTIKLWNLQSGKLLKTLKGHTSSVNSVAISPDNQKILSGSDDKTIHLWDLKP